MKESERWQQIKEIVYRALEREPDERDSFLAGECAGNEDLRKEVESLLKAHDEAESFFNAPAAEIVAEAMANDKSENLAGKSLGRYQVIELLGAGGMGEVYLAEDTLLKRRVAVKLLNNISNKNQDHLRRFFREARSASALNHPNILTIHEIGQTDETHFIATEYIKGETLRQRLKGENLTLSEMLEVAVQIAAALGAAHEAGIVHRDVKPENVMIREDGLIKVLDFGLAKLTEKRRENLDSRVSTLAQVQTNPGMILGTVAYMSPEQARGKAIDARTDIFSFGVVLYEMLTGRLPFAGETTSDVIAAILQNEPLPLAESVTGVPRELEHIIGKTLRKNRDERYQHIKDLLIDLKDLKHDLEFAAELKRRKFEDSDGAEISQSIDAKTQILEVKTTAEASNGKSAANVAAGATEKQTALPSLRIFPPRRALVYAAVLLALMSGAFGYWQLWRQTSVAPPPPQTEIKSLAVLPLKSLDSGDNYLGLGIADAVIRRISQTGELTVRPTSAVRRYLTEETDALAAARELNVDAVFEGTVQRADDRLRVSVNLLRAGDGKSLWSDSFDMRSADIFTIQDTVAQQVAARLRLHLNPTQQMRLAKRHTSNAVAYEYYLKGMYSLDQRGWSIEGKPQMEATIELFKQAINADPQYALAHAQLAFAYVWMAIFIELDPVWVEYARQEIRQAEALDSQMAETHVARHLILWSAYEGYQNEAAIRELLLAQQLNPSIGNLELGVIYWHNGLEDQADRALQRALEIDPTSEKVKAEIYNSTMLSGRADEALAALQRFFNSGPDLKYYLEKNRLNDAQPLLEQELAKYPKDPGARLSKALFLALKEDFQAAEAEIPWILENIRKDRGYHHNAYGFARIYALAGKSQEAVKWLRETAGTGKPCYPLFERDPYLNRIRQAPEFIQFMTEMKAQNERYRREFASTP